MAYDPTKAQSAITMDDLLKSVAPTGARPTSAAYGPGAIAPAAAPPPQIAPIAPQGALQPPQQTANVPGFLKDKRANAPKPAIQPAPNPYAGLPFGGQVPGRDAPVQAGPVAPLPTAPGSSPIDNAAKGQGVAGLYAGDSRQTGSVDGRPQFATNYATPNGTLTVNGPSQRMGGGTVSAPDQGNGGTVAGNVAAIERQIAALRGLREARNPGITQPQGPSMQTMMDASSPFYGREYARADAEAKLGPKELAATRTAEGQGRQAAAEKYLAARATGAQQAQAQRAAEAQAQQQRFDNDMEQNRYNLDATDKKAGWDRQRALANGEDLKNKAMAGKSMADMQQQQESNKLLDSLLKSKGNPTPEDLLQWLMASQGKNVTGLGQ